MPALRDAGTRVRTTVDGIREQAPTDLRATIAALGERHVLLRPFVLVADVMVLMVEGMLLLARNWRLVLLELVPAVWLATVLWDWRSHVLHGQSLVVVHGWAALGAAVLVTGATLVSYWCNVAFAFAATLQPPDVRTAARRATGSWRPIVFAAAVVSALHVWVSVRGVRLGPETFSIGITIVVAVQMVMYTALPAHVLGLRRERLTMRDRVGKSVLAGAVGLIAAAPGFALSRAGQLLIATSSFKILGAVVLAVAVLVQVAGVSGTRAVSTTTTWLARTTTDDAPTDQ